MVCDLGAAKPLAESAVADGGSKTAAGALPPTTPAVVVESAGEALKAPNGPVLTPAPGAEFVSEGALSSGGEAESDGGEPSLEVEVSGAPTVLGGPVGAEAEGGAGGGAPELYEWP